MKVEELFNHTFGILEKNTNLVFSEGNLKEDDPEEKICYREVYFGEKYVKEQELPLFLKRKPKIVRNDIGIKEEGEKYKDYLGRISLYLEGLETSQLNQILGKIDPTNPRYGPSIDFLMKILNEKKNLEDDKNKSFCELI